MLKWDHFDILASGKTDYHCKVKETLFIQELQPALSALNANVSSEKLLRQGYKMYVFIFLIPALNN